ncbi:MAG: hypothetical protein R3232_08315 [Clostridia bacterium]|nr:hypothetical protein [Clostridia bacterium]
MKYKSLDFSKIKTWSVKGRKDLVRIDNMFKPDIDPVPEWNDPDFEKVVDAVKIAHKNKKPVILSMGAHVIKNRLSRYIIKMIKNGTITHIAGNGATSIHDFELAYNGGTSEDVPTAIEDGSFGMWEETGKWMNEAICKGTELGMGYGESLAVYIDQHPEFFPYKEDCVLYQAWKNNVPATYHIALGTDIIHQHPDCRMGAIGAASGVDFKRYCESVSRLDNGVFLNFGSGVIGPEVFLKALSISRNLGFDTYRITTANFDLIDLGDYRKKLTYDDYDYYYRPRKNIVNRPVSRGGRGYHFCVDHKISVPNLYERTKNE